MIRLICARGLAILPALFAAIAFLAFIITYVIAVSNNDVYAYFPTISQSGIEQPERNIFTLLLAIASFLGMLTVALRFLQLQYEADCNHQYDSMFVWINRLALVIGLASCFGSLMVASFQGKGWSITGHMTGASLTFGGGVLYCWLQCYFTFRMVSCGVQRKGILMLRIGFVVMATVSLVVCIVMMKISYSVWREKYPKKADFQHWMPKNPGYTQHVISSSCEWLTAILLLSFFTTFCGEFQRIGIETKIKRREPMYVPFYSSVSEIESPLI